MLAKSSLKLSLTLMTTTVLLAPACQRMPANQMAISNRNMNNFSSAKLNRLHTKVANPKAQTMANEIVVKFKKGASSQSVMSTLKRFKLASVDKVGPSHFGTQVVKVQPGSSLTKTLQQLRQSSAVLYAEPNYVESIPEFKATPLKLARNSNDPTFPNDEMFERQYAHKVSNSQAGWKISKGSEDLVLAVIDTGVDLKHPDLAGKLVEGYDAVDGDNTPRDGHGHGTHCAGIAAAMTNNGVGVAGFAPNVKVMPIRVLGDRGSGTSADVAEGIVWAADHGAKVISMSLGSSRDAKVKADAVKYALSKDVVVVAAMGNYGNNSKLFPAATPGVIAVGATDNRDKRARFSQYGDWISVAAPGVGILATFPTYKNRLPGKNYGSISGTSMATPAAAGVAALIRSQWPEMNLTQVRAQLEKGTDDLGEEGFDAYYGAGRINVAKALTR